MALDTHQWWGLLILGLSFTLPWSVKSVPSVQWQDTQAVEGEDVVVCVDCNPLIFGERLNINTATFEQLLSLPNIGQKKAQDILTYRERNGRFETLIDLDAVRGIGPKTIQQLEPYIVIE